MNKTKFGSLLLLLQGILLILFVVFVDYGDDFKPNKERSEVDFERKLPGRWLYMLYQRFQFTT